METIRKDSSYSFEDGVVWDTEFETVEKEDGLYLTIIQETSTEEDGVAKNEIELDKSEMLILYWHLQAVLGEDNE